MEDKERKTIGQIAWQTKLIVETFLDLKVGQVLTYGEIKRLLSGADPQHEGRGYVHSAARILLNQHQIVLACETNLGYKKVEGRDAMGEAVAQKRFARRKTAKAGKILTATEYEKLSPDDQLRWNAEMVQNAMMQKVSDGAAGKKLAAHFADARKKFQNDPKLMTEAFDAIKDVLKRS